MRRYLINRAILPSNRLVISHYNKEYVRHEDLASFSRNECTAEVCLM